MNLDQWLKLHGRYERYARPVFSKALRASYEPVLQNIEVIDFTNYKALTSLLVNSIPINNAYVQVYTKIGMVHGPIIGRELNSYTKEFIRDIYESDFLRSIYQWVQTNLGQRITEVNNYTIELIQKLFETGIDRNYTITQMRVYLEKQLRSPKFNRMRSLRIARTESTTAANHAASVASESSDLVMDKEWISVIDDRTRHSHLIENGQTVGQFEPFKMSSGALLQYPGDQNGSAKEVINCRCTFNYVPRRDAEGRLMFKD